MEVETELGESSIEYCKTPLGIPMGHNSTKTLNLLHGITGMCYAVYCFLVDRTLQIPSAIYELHTC